MRSNLKVTIKSILFTLLVSTNILAQLNPIEIDLVEFGKPYLGMFAPTGMTESQTVLTIKVNVLASANASDDEVSKIKVWITDEKDARFEKGAAFSNETEHQVVWLFAVAKTAKSFILHFPSGETFDLSPLLPRNRTEMQ